MAHHLCSIVWHILDLRPVFVVPFRPHDALQLTDEETGTEWVVRTWANKNLTKKMREIHSLRCDLNRKLGVSQACTS